MTANWVPAVVTGIVGLAGIVATFWTARQARRSADRTADATRVRDDQIRLRAERRDAYVEFLVAADEASLIEEWRAMRFGSAILVLIAKQRLAMHERFFRAFTHLSLVASSDVDAACRKFTLNLRTSRTCHRDQRMPALADVKQSYDDLRGTIKDELGYLPADLPADPQRFSDRSAIPRQTQPIGPVSVP